MGAKYFIAGVIGVLALSGIAFAASYSGTPRLLDQAAFTDGTAVETLEIINSIGNRAQIVQIKQSNGIVCYAFTNIANNAPAISCTK